jgi:cell division GTPase FtsZ
MNKNSQKTNNQFQLAASIIFENNLAVDNEENLKSISSSFIKVFDENRNFLLSKAKESELVKKESLLIGFAIASGNNRAIEAIELAFSSILLNNQRIENTKSISLLISSYISEVTVDEVGEINDYIQEKTRYTTDIVMSINEDVNLGKALAVTLFLSEIESTRN